MFNTNSDSTTTGSELLQILRYLSRWVPISTLAGVLGGSASAFLLVTLAWATDTRESHKWLIAFLPLAGLFVGCLYKYLGTSVEAGNNLILDEIHNPTRTIPIRMTPLILIGTFMTHLFGGSAGREGTALQTGASLADQLAKPFRLGARERRILLMAGVSAGFASVFGTPLAGAIFGIEVLAIGTVSYDAIVPCFIAAFIGDLTTHGWGVSHTIYRVSETPPMNAKGVLCAAAAGAIFGLVGMAFARMTHGVGGFFKKHITWAPLRPFSGGMIVALAVLAIGTTRYIGLGIPTILEAFAGRQPPWEWALKLLFTVVTLGAGFKGGEVTPLFFIGATLGNALSYILPLPPSLLAGMGFVAVFAGAANTPIASTFMAVELFGGGAGAYAGIACVFAYLFSGNAGIYHAQRAGISKHAADGGLSLDLLAERQALPHVELGPSLMSKIFLEEDGTKHMTVLRLYFSAAELRQADSRSKHLTPSGLGEDLLRRAKGFGVELASLHRQIDGDLTDPSLASDIGELPPSSLQQYVELVGDEELLKEFLSQNQDHLARVHAVFLRGRKPQDEADIEKEEMKGKLDLEGKGSQIKESLGEAG